MLTCHLQERILSQVCKDLVLVHRNCPASLAGVIAFLSHAIPRVRTVERLLPGRTRKGGVSELQKGADTMRHLSRILTK